MRNTLESWDFKYYETKFLKQFGIVLSVLSFLLLISPVHASTYGSNFLTGGTATADSNNGNPASNVFDGNHATNWATTSAFPHWLKYDLGTSTSHYLDKIDIYFEADANHIFAKTLVIEGSNDNSTWTGVHTEVVADTTTNDALNTWSWTRTATTTAYRYFRITFNDNWRITNNLTTISALEWLGYECTDCGGVASSTATSTIGFMSPQLDFMLQLFIEALFVIMGLIAGYLIIKKFTKKKG